MIWSSLKNLQKIRNDYSLTQERICVSDYVLRFYVEKQKRHWDNSKKI